MAYGVINSDLMTTSDGISSAGLYGFKNRIINGAMVIDQRNAGASVTPTNGQYLVDRWQAGVTQASKLSVQQSSVAPAGFTKSLLVTSLSSYSVVSTDGFTIQQMIEGYNIADLGWGAVGASSVTLSFWVRSSLTGTFGGVLENSGYARSYPFTYTISSANTWEQKTITVTGDTTGTWNTDNTGGINVRFSLGAGATLSGTAGSWAGANYASATGATSVVGTSGATLYITGVQLEKGSTATSFDYRPYGTELALCQRYYYKMQPAAAGGAYGFGYNQSTTNAFIQATFPVTMRTAVTAVEQSGTATDYAVVYLATGAICSAVPSFQFGSQYGCAVNFTTAAVLTAGQASMGRNQTSNGYLSWSAEL